MAPESFCVQTPADEASLGALVKSLEFHAGKRQLVVCPGPWACRFLFLVVSFLRSSFDADVIQAYEAPSTERTRETDAERHIPPCEVPEGQTLQQAVERATFKPSFISEEDFRKVTFAEPIDLVYFWHSVADPERVKAALKLIVCIFDHQQATFPISPFTKAQTQEVTKRLWKIAKKHFETVNAGEHAYLEFAKHHKADIANLQPASLATMFLLSTPIRAQEFAPARPSSRGLTPEQLNTHTNAVSDSYKMYTMIKRLHH